MGEARVRPSLSVVIPVFNRPVTLGLVLAALSAQAAQVQDELGRRCEVIVADDGSEIDSEAAVLGQLEDRARAAVRWVRLPANRGRAAARNAGAALAAGDRLLFLDCDSYPGRGLLARHCGAPEPVVLVGRRLEPGWGPLASMIDSGGEEPEIERFEEDFRVSYLGFDEGMPGLPHSAAPWLNAYSHNISVPAALFARTGGFDEQMRRWGHEDIEFGLRLFKAGATFRYDRAAFCAHLPHGRDIHGDAAGAEDNLRYIKRKHQCVDTELLGKETYTNIERKVGYYKDVIRSMRARRDRVTGDEVLDELGAGLTGPTLWIGCRLGPAGRDGDVAFDHERGEALLGLDTPFADGRFAAVVNIDLWRALSVSDLCLAVAEGLRVARRLVLVESSGPGRAPIGPGGAPFIEEALTTRGARATTVRRERFSAVLLEAVPA